jgi:hypothetical protein
MSCPFPDECFYREIERLVSAPPSSREYWRHLFVITRWPKEEFL